jgi:UDP-glucose 4-epimerase
MSKTLSDQEILITGGAGFIGSHIADELVDCNDVTIVDDLSTGDKSNVPAAATFVRGDVRDEGVMRPLVAEADCIFHEAAQVSVDQSVDEPVTSHGRNVDATLQVLDLAREFDSRVVLASSCAIYGHADTVPITETAKKTPESPYGLEKLAIDHYARLYADLYGLETVSLRYFNVYGPRATASDYAGVIDVFLQQARAGNPIIVHGDGSQTRDFVHVSDVVRANLLAATTQQTGEAFNVGTGSETSIIELARLCRDAVGSNSEITNTSPRQGDIERSRADIAKATEKLGYEPSVSVAEGVVGLEATEETTQS